MTNEEYYKIREQRHSRWKNMTDVQRKEIDDKLVERDRMYAEIEEYRKQGKIHPAEIDEAKKILSWRYDVRNTGSDIIMEDLIGMEAYAKDVLKRAGEITNEEKKQTLKRLDDESERCYQQMKNWVETKKWDNGSDIDPVSYERIMSDYRYGGYMFNKGDVVVAKDGYLDKGETLQDTVGIVLSYNPENDYLVLGTLHPEKYAIAPTFSMRGCFYRLITEQERLAWDIV